MVFSNICACEVSTDSDGMHPGTRIAALVTELRIATNETKGRWNTSGDFLTKRLGYRTAQFSNRF